VGHPLAAGHELVGGIIAEGVAHAAVPPAEAHTGRDGVEQATLLLGRDRAHRPHLRDQVESAQALGIQVGVERVADLHPVPGRLDQRREDFDAGFGLVALPAAPDEQRGFGH
jgi:hypothetical protein